MISSIKIISSNDINIDLFLNLNDILLIKSENNSNFKINKKEALKLYNSINNCPWSKAWSHISIQLDNFINNKKILMYYI